MADYGTPLSSPLHPRNWYKRQEEKAMTTTDARPPVKGDECACGAHFDGEAWWVQISRGGYGHAHKPRALTSPTPSAPLTEED